MTVLTNILNLVVTLMVVIPFVAFMFSWCCSIYFTQKAKHDGASLAFKLFSQEAMKKAKEKKDDQG